MHEFAITKELFRTAREYAIENGISIISEIHIQVGTFSSFEPDSISYYFDELKIRESLFSSAILSFKETISNDLKISTIIPKDSNSHELDKSLRAKNDEIASNIQNKLNLNNIFCINLMGSPGSGKTTLISKLSKYLSPLYVIQGDLKSEVDKKKMDELGIPCYQINTHSGCHLNAKLISDALENIKLKENSYLIIENVGNLVCPAGVKMGQHINILANATTEGFDKPEKYPLIFKDSEIIIITKYDLKDAVEFNEDEYLMTIKEKIGKKKIFKTSKNNPKSFLELTTFIHSLNPHNQHKLV